MRGSEGFIAWIENADGVSGLGFATVHNVTRKDPRMSRPEAVCALAIHFDAMHAPFFNRSNGAPDTIEKEVKSHGKKITKR